MKMNEQKQSFFSQNRAPIIVLIVCIVIAAIVFPFLPEQIPMQWGVGGQVSRYGSRWEVFLIAALPALIFWSLKRKYGRK